MMEVTLYNDVIYRLPIGEENTERLKRGGWWKRLVTWLKDYDQGLGELERKVPREANGELAETMRGLRK